MDYQVENGRRTGRRAAFWASWTVVLFCLLPLSSGPTAAAINNGAASTFINDLGTSAIDMLADKSIDQTTRIERFRKLLKNGFALEAISRFVLGRYWNKISPEQRDRYVTLFEDYVVASYANRLEEYGGETFKVTGEKFLNERTAAVTTVILRPQGPPVEVDWRILERNGEFKIVDVVIEGISMSLTQRSDFASAIRSNGGNIDAFLDALEKKVRP